MRIFPTALLLTLILSSQLSFAQFKIITLRKADLPKDINYKGRIVNAVRWTDKQGENTVIATETGEVPGKEEDWRSANLFAYHFLKKNNINTPTWKVSDGVEACPVDIAANFIRGSFQVTDLNKDGIGEIWLMYKTVCHGDVSPLTMKIVMYQGTQKFAVRGRNKVKISDTEYEGGEYNFDQAFQLGPKVFRDFALDLWKKNLMQVWE